MCDRLSHLHTHTPRALNNTTRCWQEEQVAQDICMYIEVDKYVAVVESVVESIVRYLSIWWH